jgi:hypothetical protein
MPRKLSSPVQIPSKVIQAEGSSSQPMTIHSSPEISKGKQECIHVLKKNLILHPDESDEISDFSDLEPF